jgi:predicted dinucleotide-binding enzyme
MIGSKSGSEIAVFQVMKIGIIGSGKIGSAISRHWAEAGHQLLVSAKHRENAERLVKRLGENRAKAVKPEESAQQGEVVLLTIPLGEVPQLSPELKEALRGKIVIDTCNPYPERDGQPAKDVFQSGRGTGVWTSSQIPGARVVRAFNSVHAEIFETEAHRKGDPVGVPLASDDEDALEKVAQLVRDAGFGPVVLGRLENAKLFDPGTPTYGTDVSDQELRNQFKQSGVKASDSMTH